MSVCVLSNLEEQTWDVQASPQTLLSWRLVRELTMWPFMLTNCSSSQCESVSLTFLSLPMYLVCAMRSFLHTGCGALPIDAAAAADSSVAATASTEKKCIARDSRSVLVAVVVHSRVCCSFR